MKKLISNILSVIIIVVPLYTIAVGIKYITMADEYGVFLDKVLEYDTIILDTVKELEKAGYIKEALAVAETAVRMESIDTWWHMNVLNWTTDKEQFLPTPSRYFDYWLQTGKLLFPEPEIPTIQGQSV